VMKNFSGRVWCGYWAHGTLKTEKNSAQDKLERRLQEFGKGKGDHKKGKDVGGSIVSSYEKGEVVGGRDVLQKGS